MTNDIPDPTTVVRAMLETAAEVGSVERMPNVGTFAAYYANKIGSEVTTENVESFMYGAALANLLVQEAMLRVSMTAAECQDPDGLCAYDEGALDATRALASMMAENLEAVVQIACEQQFYDKSFEEIVATLA